MKRPLKPAILSSSGSRLDKPDYSKIENDKSTHTVISMSSEYPKYRDAIILGGVILLFAVFVGGLYLLVGHKDWAVRKLVGRDWSILYAGFYHNRGLNYYKKDQYEKAISAFTKAIKINPKLAKAYANRGYIHAGKGQYDKAISDYNRAIEINPKNAKTYYNRGYAYAQGRSQYEKAILDFNKAIEINPHLVEAYNNRGNAYYHKGQHEEAISDYNRAIEINPKDAHIYYNRGNVYAQGRGQYDKAISDYNRAIEINPKYAEAYTRRGITFFYKREYEQAWDDVNKAQDLGYQVSPKFLKVLREASGREK